MAQIHSAHTCAHSNTNPSEVLTSHYGLMVSVRFKGNAQKWLSNQSNRSKALKTAVDFYLKANPELLGEAE